jgi:hypothetical protein
LDIERRRNLSGAVPYIHFPACVVKHNATYPIADQTLASIAPRIGAGRFDDFILPEKESKRA